MYVGFVYHDRSRDQVLNSLYQILKERKLKLDEKSSTNEKMYFAPHYVVLITDEKLILDHVVMEFFNDDQGQLGVSLVFVQGCYAKFTGACENGNRYKRCKTREHHLRTRRLVNQSI